jgi:hypothetical protein
MATNSDKTPENRFVTNMVLTLSLDDRVLIQIDAWYLILSAILRGGPPFLLDDTLSLAMLTGRIEIGGQGFTFEIPQPPEFKGDNS